MRTRASRDFTPTGVTAAPDISKPSIDNIEITTAPEPNLKKEPPPCVSILTPEERHNAEKKLVRKIDIRLLPVLVIMYILNYLDRNNIVGVLVYYLISSSL